MSALAAPLSLYARASSGLEFAGKDRSADDDACDTSCSDPLLKFELAYTDGGEYSEAYGCSNVFRDDGSTYCSQKKDCVNVVASHSGGRPFTLTAVEVAVPQEGFTSPLSTGVVFVCSGSPDVEATHAFDHVNSRSDFEQVRRQYCADALSQPESRHPMPALFFDLKGKHRCTFQLDAPRTGTCVVVKLLRSKYLYADNIDVEFIGLHGRCGPMSFGSTALA